MRRVFLVLILIVSQFLYGQSYYTGNGGSGISLGIIVPESEGLTLAQAYLPLLVQGGLVASISKYSAISVMDRVSFDRVVMEIYDGMYEDSWDIIQLGHVSHLGYILTGKITRTLSGYALYFNISDTVQGRTRASYLGVCEAAQLEALTAVQAVAKELLIQMGVNLTSRAMDELGTFPKLEAQVALAYGILAQQRGTTIEALSHYVRAVSYDASLEEAIARVSVMKADINSGNIGQDARNDIQWRREWVNRLQEFEAYYKRYTQTIPVYYLVYTTQVKDVAINYGTERASISFDYYLMPDVPWFEGINSVYRILKEGLDATGRAKTWGLDWPAVSVLDKKPFVVDIHKTLKITGVLTNSNNVALSTQETTTHIYANKGIPYNLLLPELSYVLQLTFNNVDANRITDTLSISFRPNAAINILPASEYNAIPTVYNNGLDMPNYTSYEYYYRSWAEPEVRKGSKRPVNIIPYGISLVWSSILLGETAILPPTVREILSYDSEDYLTTITIGADVKLTVNTGGLSMRSGLRIHSFYAFYRQNGSKAGTYVYRNGQFALL